MGFIQGKNGLLKRNAKPQRTKKQSDIYKLTKKLQASLDAAAQKKTIVTRRKGQEIQRTVAKADPNKVDPLCPICNIKMELKVPKRGQDWETFWGCPNFKTKNCKGRKKYAAPKSQPDSNDSPTDY